MQLLVDGGADLLGFFSLSCWIAASLPSTAARTCPCAHRRLAGQPRLLDLRQRRWPSEPVSCCWVVDSWRLKASIWSFWVRALLPCWRAACAESRPGSRRSPDASPAAFRDLVAQVGRKPLERRVDGRATQGDPERDDHEQREQRRGQPVDEHDDCRSGSAHALGHAARSRRARLFRKRVRGRETSAARRCRRPTARAAPAPPPAAPREQHGAVVDRQAGDDALAEAPAPTKAAIVAVPTLITAAVLIPASTVGIARGNGHGATPAAASARARVLPGKAARDRVQAGVGVAPIGSSA